jgi:hypothetical protein
MNRWMKLKETRISSEQGCSRRELTSVGGTVSATASPSLAYFAVLPFFPLAMIDIRVFQTRLWENEDEELTLLLVRGYGLKFGWRRGFDVPSGKSPSASPRSKYILKGEPKFLTPAGVNKSEIGPKDI